MAEINPILEYVKRESTKGDFEPHAFYSEDSDSLTFYFRDAPDYSERLHSRVTVFYSMEDNKLVGCRIKNVKRVLDDIGAFPVHISHEDSEIAMLFLAFRGDVFDSEEARGIWKTLMEESGKVRKPICRDNPERKPTTA